MRWPSIPTRTIHQRVLGQSLFSTLDAASLVGFLLSVVPPNI